MKLKEGNISFKETNSNFIEDVQYIEQKVFQIQEFELYKTAGICFLNVYSNNSINTVYLQYKYSNNFMWYNKIIQVSK